MEEEGTHELTSMKWHVSNAKVKRFPNSGIAYGTFGGVFPVPVRFTATIPRSQVMR